MITVSNFMRKDVTKFTEPLSIGFILIFVDQTFAKHFAVLIFVIVLRFLTITCLTVPLLKNLGLIICFIIHFHGRSIITVLSLVILTHSTFKPTGALILFTKKHSGLV